MIPLALIAMNGCEALGKKTDALLLQDGSCCCFGEGKGSFLVRTFCPRFGTGEGKGVLLEPVQDCDLYILCDIGAYQCTYQVYGMTVPMMPDDHYADLKRILSALRGRASRISVIMPRLYGGLQRYSTGRESLDCAVMLQELAGMGVSRVITVDAPDPSVENAIPLNDFVNLVPSEQILQAVTEELSGECLQNVMVISPDEVSLERSSHYCSAMQADMGFFCRWNKHLAYVGEDTHGKVAFITDGMITSGDRLLAVAVELRKRGARKVMIGVTYALFTRGLERYDSAYQQGVFDRVFATDLTYVPQPLQARPWFKVVDMSRFLASVITRMNHNRF